MDGLLSPTQDSSPPAQDSSPPAQDSSPPAQDSSQAAPASPGQRLIAGAIAFAGACMGLGLYFGLSAARAPAPPAAPEPAPVRSPVSTASHQPTPAASVVSPRAARAAERAALQKRVEAQAGRALGKLRGELVKRCWQPSVAVSPEPAETTFRVRLMFDADGKKTIQGVADAADPRRADVVQCLRDYDLDIKVEPPGLLVGARLKLTLP